MRLRCPASLEESARSVVSRRLTGLAGPDYDANITLNLALRVFRLLE